MRNYCVTYLSFYCAAVLGISMQYWDDIQKSFLPKSLVLSDDALWCASFVLSFYNPKLSLRSNYKLYERMYASSRRRRRCSLIRLLHRSNACVCVCLQWDDDDDDVEQKKIWIYFIFISHSAYTCYYIAENIIS